METQIAIETSRIIKASTQTDSLQSLVTFVYSSSSGCSQRPQMHWKEGGCVCVYRPDITSLHHTAYLTPQTCKLRLTASLLMLIRSLIFTGIISRHYEYWM